MIEQLGILSDNHGRTERIGRVVEIFTRQQVDAVMHCGDIGGLETLELLSGWYFWFVWGNTDRPEAGWQQYLEHLGGYWPIKQPFEITIEDAKIILAHGHEADFSPLSYCNQYDYVISGHTHRAAHRQVGSTHFINPGALYRTSCPTVAILNLVSHRVEFIPID